MSPRLCLLGLTVLVAGCNVFKNEGAACIGDTNCPGNQVCCSGKCEKSCGDAGGMAVSTSLATDWVPGYEFDTITVDLDGVQHQVSVNAVTELINPRTISQFTGIAHGAHTMTITLTLASAPIAARVIDFSATSDITVPFTLTRTCGGVACTAPNDQCLGGACVTRDCSDLTPANCPSPTCGADTDCTAASTCSLGVCISGVCMQRRQDTLCAADQRCIPGTGCVVEKHECDVEPECDDLAACTQERCTSNRCSSARDDTRCGTTVCDPTSKTADPVSGCTPAPCSPDTCIPGPCETATCGDDGECQHTKTCQGSEQCCAGVCALNCNDPRACAGRPAGYTCRVPVGACDIAEVCDGTSDACPPDIVAAHTLVCRAKGGGCDIAELCDGTSGQCPPNTLVSAGTVCRAKADVCDVAEVCTGEASACPVDVYAPMSLVCRNSAGICDVAEACTGSGPACPADAFQPSSTVCKPSAGVCDVVDYCSGTTATCADALMPATAACRPSAGACDPTENCTGASPACPGDAHSPAGTPCRSAASNCDIQENCDGGVACPGDAVQPAGTLCAGAPNACYQNSYCNGTNACPGFAPAPAGTYYAPIDACREYVCDGAFGAVVQGINPGAACGGGCGYCSGDATGCINQSCEQYGGSANYWYCSVAGGGPGACVYQPPG